MRIVIEKLIALKRRWKNNSLFFVLLILLASCSKQAVHPREGNSLAPVAVANLHLSESRVTLLQGNASTTAVNFDWDGTNTETTYTIEAALHNSSFEDPVVIASTGQTSMRFTVGQFNDLMCQLLYGNQTGYVDFRIRVDCAANKATYSKAVALDVTTYQPYIEYGDNNTFRVPGNYQNWIVASAPTIVSKGDGAFEGYINFTNDNPQVLLVKGEHWDPNITFTYIGAEKFGFGGTMLSVFGGAGVYLFKANTNTNKWGYTKINTWNINGSAATDAGSMIREKDGLAWSITTNLAAGNFRIRANNSDAVSFGHKVTDAVGIPSYDGANIDIKKSGNYTIRLELQTAGNYNYSIQKNS